MWSGLGEMAAFALLATSIAPLLNFRAMPRQTLPVSVAFHRAKGTGYASSGAKSAVAGQFRNRALPSSFGLPSKVTQ
jgi:hypothetical protein